jgi:hypothetical protein
VNADPLPGSFVTIPSPPIMRASLRVMARPAQGSAVKPAIASEERSASRARSQPSMRLRRHWFAASADAGDPKTATVHRVAVEWEPLESRRVHCH